MALSFAWAQGDAQARPEALCCSSGQPSPAAGTSPSTSTHTGGNKEGAGQLIHLLIGY